MIEELEDEEMPLQIPKDENAHLDSEDEGWQEEEVEEVYKDEDYEQIDRLN